MDATAVYRDSRMSRDGKVPSFLGKAGEQPGPLV
jgi:hypothetical protein